MSDERRVCANCLHVSPQEEPCARGLGHRETYTCTQYELSIDPVTGFRRYEQCSALNTVLRPCGVFKSLQEAIRERRQWEHDEQWKSVEEKNP